MPALDRAVDRLGSLLPEGRSSQLLLAAMGVGVLVGLAVSVVDYLIVELLLDRLFDWPLYIQVMAPLVGLLGAVAILTTIGAGCSPSTSDEYIHAFHARHPDLSRRPLVARIAAGVSTIGLGGAVGIEGPSVYLGSTIGFKVHATLQRWLGRDNAKLLLTAGAAAGVSAIFQAPATGLVFALESPYRDDVVHRALLPSLVASASSYLTFVFMPFVHPTTVLGFTFETDLGLGDLLGAVALGAAAGVGGRWFAWAVRRAKSLRHHHSAWKLAGVGGVVLGALAWLSNRVFDQPLTLGPGVEVVEWLRDEPPLGLIVLAFAFRAVATLVTVGSGGVGGLFIPLAIQGVLMGRFVGDGLQALDLADNTTIWPFLGLAAFLAAGYRTPIAAVMFVAESSRGAAVVPALVAAAVSQLVAGPASVSAGQRVERTGHLEARFTLPLTAALTTDVMTVPPDATISEFVWAHAIGRRQPSVPVVDGSRYLGLCSIAALSGIDRADWETTTVSAVIDAGPPTAHPSWSLRDAVAAMDSWRIDQLAVTDQSGTFIGVVYMSEIVKLGEILDETDSVESG